MGGTSCDICLVEDGKQERLGLSRTGAGHNDQIAPVDQTAADGLRLVHVGRVVDEPGQIALWSGDCVEGLERCRIEAAHFGEALARLVPGRGLNIWDLVDDAGDVQKTFAASDQRLCADVVGGFDVVAQCSVELLYRLLDRLHGRFL